MKAILARIPRYVVTALVAGLVVCAVVLVASRARGESYEGRVGLLAGPAPGAAATSAPYGEIVSLGLAAFVELARSPTVVQVASEKAGMSPDELAANVSVELVPASGLVRLSVRAPSAAQASAAVLATSQAMIAADLLAPAGKLRLVDKQPEITRVSPDLPLALGLALAAGAAAAVGAVVVHRLRRPHTGAAAVRAVLADAGIRHPVAITREDDPALIERLTVLCDAASRPVRVMPVVPELAEQAEALAQRLPDKTGEPATGTALIALVPTPDKPPAELANVVGVLPGSAVLVAVVLA